MKICLILERIGTSRCGMSRSFINWAKAEKSFTLITFRCGFKTNLENSVVVDDYDSLVSETSGSDYVVTDDWHMRSGERVSARCNAKLVVYAQIPYAIHALGIKIPEYLPFGRKLFMETLRYIPFRLLSAKYVGSMQKAAKVVSNSFIVEMLLKFVYGVETCGTAYPPVDISIFKPCAEKREQITLYTGSAWDDDTGLISVACREGILRELSVHAFGNRERLPQKFASKVIFHSMMDDLELARLYSESRAIVAPQTYETFGYVPIEAACCGTPTITGYFHEALLDDRNSDVIIQASNKNFSKVLDATLSQPRDENFQNRCASIARKYCSQRSVSSFIDKITG